MLEALRGALVWAPHRLTSEGVVHSSALDATSQKTRLQNLVALGASAIAVLVCLFGNLGAVGLLGPDEPRYAWIARSMAESGDWVTPRLFGQPWFEKPILYYWAAALGFRVPLSAEWAARLPSALAALLAALAISWLAWRFFDRQGDFVRGPSLIAPLLFSTTVAAIGFSRAATPDMLFASAITLAMACASGLLARRGAILGANSHSSPRSQNDAILLVGWGAFLGASVLAKGPAAVILAAGALVIWALATREWRVSLRLLHPLAIASFFVVCAPWYVLCARRNPDFLRIFIWQHNFERYLTPMFMHRQPFWFFGPIFLLALLPWTILLWPASLEAIRLWRERSFQKSPAIFFACWTIFPVLFFSASQSKLPSYILPAIPPAALLLAASWSRLSNPESSNRHIRSWTIAALGLTWIALGAAAYLWLRRLPAYEQDEIRAALFELIGLVTIGGLAILIFGLRRSHLAFAISAFLAVASVALVNGSLLPALDPYLSARPHAALLRNSRFPNRIFTFQLKRSWSYGLAFYFHRELPEWSPQDPDAALLLTTPAGLAEMKARHRFGGVLEENYRGILFVPVLPAARFPEGPPINPQAPAANSEERK
jgi:4-amino-4-deoxy-L-arabinose transferase-like glycosyltransferase